MIYSSIHRKALFEAILSAVNRAELRRLVRHELGTDIDRVVARGTFDDEVVDLVEWSARQERLEDLARAIAKSAPKNSKIADFIATLGIASIDQEVAQFNERLGHETADPHNALEVTVRKRFPSLSYTDWLSKLAAAQSAMCMIELETKDKTTVGGSGFAVGPHAILTNYHVVRQAIEVSGSVSCIKVIHNWVDAQKRRETILELPTEMHWLLAASPFVPGEPFSDDRATNGDCLDFALIDIGAVNRKYLPLPGTSAKPVASDILFILQHPRFRKLEIAVGAVTGTNANGTRIKYDTNTEEGSSGSPCFDANLSLVALHHAGLGTGLIGRINGKGAFNQGIPISLIRNALEQSPEVRIDEGGVLHLNKRQSLTKEAQALSNHELTLVTPRSTDSAHSPLSLKDDESKILLVRKCGWNYVDIHLLPLALIRAAATAAPGALRLPIISAANRIRTSADPDYPPDSVIIDPSGLPPSIANDINFWTAAFQSACARGGRSLSSLLLALPLEVQVAQKRTIGSIIEKIIERTNGEA